MAGRPSAAGVGRRYPCANPEEMGPEPMRQLAWHRAARCCRQGPGESHSDENPGHGQQLPPGITMRLSARQILHGHGVQRTSAAREDHRAYSQGGFFVFIDLKKAYDSVPRECLWQVLSRAGVLPPPPPPPLLAVIRSFHHEMSAVLRVSGTDVDPFSVTNGLRQGCTMAPVLFNIFMWAVVTK